MFERGYPVHDTAVHEILSTPLRLNADTQRTGKGITVAFVDSGFYPHPDLGDRVLTHVDATEPRVVESRRRFHRPMWYGWHGQMTSTIACGDGRLSEGYYRGLAPQANLVLIKVSTPKRQIKEPDILRGLEWLTAHHVRFGVRVVNVSVGGDFPNADPEYSLHRVVRRLVDEGVVVVTAGGNNPSAPLVPPATAPEAITVGGYDDHNSLDRTHWRLYGHSTGRAFDGTPKPDILAPAAWIASPILPRTSVARESQWLAPLMRLPKEDAKALRTLLKEAYTDLGLTKAQATRPTAQVMADLQSRILEHKIIHPHYQHVGGTSVAAAVVSGLVAQMLEANSRLTPGMVKDMLIRTAVRLPEAPLEPQGAGAIRAGDAVANAAAHT
ncbi:MAG: S8 family serine peptidase [bacterium]|nr:S8 family serine peptidase [bacterium]